jgi:hypothetical protein
MAGTCGQALTVERAQLFISPYRSRPHPRFPRLFEDARTQLWPVDLTCASAIHGADSLPFNEHPQDLLLGSGASMES